MNNDHKILIVGIGNTIRVDDGLGWYICARLEELKMPGVDTLTVQQLNTELLEDFVRYRHIMLVDAALDREPVRMYELTSADEIYSPSSHQTDAATIKQMAKLTYGRDLSLQVCAVAGYDFEMGENISPQAKRNADNAVNMICEWIFDHT